jgi:hypothetical protein
MPFLAKSVRIIQQGYNHQKHSAQVGSTVITETETARTVGICGVLATSLT